MSTYTIRSAKDRDRASVAVGLLNLEGERAWDVTIEKHVEQRTLSQNRLMRMWNKVIGDERGYTQDEIHELLMPLFLVPKIVKIGSVERLVYTTKGLSIGEMSEYLDHIYRWAAGEGIILPLPEELHERTA